MVRCRERTAECSTCLTIGHKRVGKEKTCLGSKSVCYLTGLTHKAVLHLHAVVDRATVADDGVLADNTCSDEYRCIHRAHHRTLTQTCSTANLAVALDDGVGNILGVDDLHVVSDVAAIGT